MTRPIKRLARAPTGSRPRRQPRGAIRTKELKLHRACGRAAGMGMLRVESLDDGVSDHLGFAGAVGQASGNAAPSSPRLMLPRRAPASTRSRWRLAQLIDRDDAVPRYASAAHRLTGILGTLAKSATRRCGLAAVQEMTGRRE